MYVEQKQYRATQYKHVVRCCACFHSCALQEQYNLPLYVLPLMHRRVSGAQHRKTLTQPAARSVKPMEKKQDHALLAAFAASHQEQYKEFVSRGSQEPRTLVLLERDAFSAGIARSYLSNHGVCFLCAISGIIYDQVRDYPLCSITWIRAPLSI